jgi:hypothetical protein
MLNQNGHLLSGLFDSVNLMHNTFLSNPMGAASRCKVNPEEVQGPHLPSGCQLAINGFSADAHPHPGNRFSAPGALPIFIQVIFDHAVTAAPDEQSGAAGAEGVRLFCYVSDIHIS